MDSSSVEVYFKDWSCILCEPERVYFSSEQLEVADSQPTELKVNFRPGELTDGTYELILIDPQDGKNSYSSRFRIENAFSMSGVKLYPNPSYGDVFFVFEMKGEDLPDAFFVKLYSNEGVLVGELSKYEIPHLHIGRNVVRLSTMSLRPGLYIYNVIIEIDGQEYERKGKLVKL